MTQVRSQYLRTDIDVGVHHTVEVLCICWRSCCNKLKDVFLVVGNHVIKSSQHLDTNWLISIFLELLIIRCEARNVKVFRKYVTNALQINWRVDGIHIFGIVSSEDFKHTFKLNVDVKSYVDKIINIVRDCFVLFISYFRQKLTVIFCNTFLNLTISVGSHKYILSFLEKSFGGKEWSFKEEVPGFIKNYESQNDANDSNYTFEPWVGVSKTKPKSDCGPIHEPIFACGHSLIYDDMWPSQHLDVNISDFIARITGFGMSRMTMISPINGLYHSTATLANEIHLNNYNFNKIQA